LAYVFLFFLFLNSELPSPLSSRSAQKRNKKLQDKKDLTKQGKEVEFLIWPLAIGEAGGGGGLRGGVFLKSFHMSPKKNQPPSPKTKNAATRFYVWFGFRIPWCSRSRSLRTKEHKGPPKKTQR
jgi:hypothetical protein